MIEIEITDDLDKEFPIPCDGCGKALEGKYITGIKSCCGGGCVRALCLDCAELAGNLAIEARKKDNPK